MMFLVPIFVVGICVLGTYKLFELYARKKERILMIEKLASLCENSGDKDEQLKIRLPFIIGSDTDYRFWPLRISLLLIGIGAGCLVAFFIQINASIASYHDQFYDLIVLVNFASISFFGGIGLFAAFLIEQKMKAKK